MPGVNRLDRELSNSLIIHEPDFLPITLLVLGHVYLVRYSVKHSVSCFHLVSDGRGEFMSCA